MTRIIVAGMHHSGASPTACLLASAGIDMGRDTATAAARSEGCSFQCSSAGGIPTRLLQPLATTRPDGLPELGWWPGFDPAQLPIELHHAVAAAVAGAAPGAGWKDCFATLLPEIVDRIVGEPFWIFVYRYPWDVADSLQRSGRSNLLSRPADLVRAWESFNRLALDFVRRHRDRSLLISAARLLANPEEFLNLAASRFALGFSREPRLTLIRPELMNTIEGDDPLVAHFARACPDAVALLRELDQAADLPAAGRWNPVTPQQARLTPDGVEPPLSVVIPCFNDGVFLPESIASVERNAPAGTELIIVNDGSTDPFTLKLLADLRTDGYTVLDQAQSGASTARNHGFRQARSPLVLPLDADNRLRPGFAQAALTAMGEAPDIGVVYGDWWEFGLRTGRRHAPEFRIEKLLTGNFIDTSALIRKDAWQDAGGYELSDLPWEDWAFWIAVAAAGWRFRRLAEDECDLTFDYRARPGSLNSLADSRETRLQLFHRICDRHRLFIERHLPETLEAAWAERAVLQQALEETVRQVERLRAGRRRTLEMALRVRAARRRPPAQPEDPSVDGK